MTVLRWQESGSCAPQATTPPGRLPRPLDYTPGSPRGLDHIILVFVVKNNWVSFICCQSNMNLQNPVCET